MDSDYRAIFDAANDLIFVHDPITGRILDVNQSACETLGYTREEMLQLTVGDISSPEPPYGRVQAIQRIAKTQQEEPQLFEWRCKDRSGKLFWVEVNLKTVRMADEKRVLAVVRDISKRKQVEEALRQSEAQYRTTIDSLGDAMHVIDSEFRILLANTRLKQWLGGLNLDQDPVGRGVFEAFPFLPESVRRQYQSVFRSGGALVTAETVELDDRKVTTETRKIPVFEDGKVVRVITVLRDITEQKNAEEALRESEQNFRAVAENANDGMLVSAGEGETVYANRRIAEITGFTVPELLGTTIRDLAHPDEANRVVSRFRERIAGRDAPSQYETAIVRKDGEDVPVEVTAARTEWRGQPASMVIFRDITERRRLEQEIIRISEHERQRIAQDLHDDLGQQICGIGLIARALEQKLRQQSLPESADAAKIGELLNEAATTTRELARGLLPVEVESGGLAAAIENLAAKVEQLLDIPCRFSATQPILVSDHLVAGHLFRIAQEAISNALRHGSPKQIEVRMEQADDTLTLNIEDDGVGVPAATDGIQGLGIRLMRHRASLIGASLTIRPNTPKGTVVTCAVGIRNEQTP